MGTSYSRVRVKARFRARNSFIVQESKYWGLDFRVWVVWCWSAIAKYWHEVFKVRVMVTFKNFLWHKYPRIEVWMLSVGLALGLDLELAIGSNVQVLLCFQMGIS